MAIEVAMIVNWRLLGEAGYQDGFATLKSKSHTYLTEILPWQIICVFLALAALLKLSPFDDGSPGALGIYLVLFGVDLTWSIVAYFTLQPTQKNGYLTHLGRGANFFWTMALTLGCTLEKLAQSGATTSAASTTLMVVLSVATPLYVVGWVNWERIALGVFQFTAPFLPSWHKRYKLPAKDKMAALLRKYNENERINVVNIIFGAVALPGVTVGMAVMAVFIHRDVGSPWTRGVAYGFCLHAFTGIWMVLKSGISSPLKRLAPQLHLGWDGFLGRFQGNEHAVVNAHLLAHGLAITMILSSTLLEPPPEWLLISACGFVVLLKLYVNLFTKSAPLVGPARLRPPLCPMSGSKEHQGKPQPIGARSRGEEQCGLCTMAFTASRAKDRCSECGRVACIDCLSWQKVCDECSRKHPASALTPAIGKPSKRLVDQFRACAVLHDRSTFSNCFVARQTVTRLVSTGALATREEAVLLGEQLMDQGYIRHVEGMHSFKDEDLFFEFTTRMPPPDSAFAEGGCPFQRLLNHSRIPVWKDSMLDKYFTAYSKSKMSPSWELNDHDFDTTFGQGNTVGFLSAMVTIDPSSLPRAAQVGLFSRARSLPAVIRFSDFGASTDAVRFARMALKMPWPDANGGEINWLFTETLPTFPSAGFSDLASYVGDLPTLTQKLHWATTVFGGILSDKLGPNFIDKEVLQKPFYSQLPYALGDHYAMKFAVFPRSDSPKAARPAETPLEWAPNRRRMLAQMLRSAPTEFDIRVQVRPYTQDPCRTRDSVETQHHLAWKEPWITVGRIVIPQQECNDTGVSVALAQALADQLEISDRDGVHKMFRFHLLTTCEEHVPLGEINAFRCQFYEHQAVLRLTTIQAGLHRTNAAVDAGQPGQPGHYRAIPFSAIQSDPRLFPGLSATPALSKVSSQ
jgi:Domain found in Dishevelled, Egl-10, and Pleckstrin (DEP)